MTNHSQQNFNGKYFTFLVFFPCKIQYFGPKIVKNYQFTWFCSQRSIFKSKLSPKKERSIRKYGKSPNEVSFFERSITGHPGINIKIIVQQQKIFYATEKYFSSKKQASQLESAELLTPCKNNIWLFVTWKQTIGGSLSWK